MSMSYQMQLHLAHKERLQRFFKAAVKYEKKKKRKPYTINGPTPLMVLSVVADYYDASYKIMWKARSQLMASYRGIVYYICYKILNYSYQKIVKGLSLSGKYIVCDGLQAFRKQLAFDPRLALDLRAIRLKLIRKYNLNVA